MKHLFTHLGFQKANTADHIEHRSAGTRYRYTLELLSQGCSAWCLLDEGKETITLDFDGCIHVCIWPSREAAQKYADLAPDEKSTPREIPISEFLETTRNLSSDPQYLYAVYPTQQDFWIIKPGSMLSDLKETDFIRRNHHE